MRLLRRNVLALVLLLWPCIVMSQAPGTPPKNNLADAGRQLRLKMLTTPPADLGIHPSSDFPRVYGIVVDWPIGDQWATIVSLSDGNASLYTTSTFGVIGGIGHESVRSAAKKFVQASDLYFEDSTPASDYPYPRPNGVRFYLLTFHGVRVINADFASICTMKDRYSGLFGQGQNVLTQLRQVTENKK